MTEAHYEIVYYELPSGKCPYEKWFDGLDRKAQDIIDARLERVELGNFGDHRYLDKGVYELKFKIGPAYRIYYGQYKNQIVVLLCGGDKSTQNKDIRKAQEYWQGYLKEKENAS